MQIVGSMRGEYSRVTGVYWTQNLQLHAVARTLWSGWIGENLEGLTNKHHDLKLVHVRKFDILYSHANFIRPKSVRATVNQPNRSKLVVMGNHF